MEDQPDTQVYGMMDGSFLFTDDGWKEVKVGRVFTATPNASADKWSMGQSEYVAQSGHYKNVAEKLKRFYHRTADVRRYLSPTEHHE